jgi:dynactin-6
LQAPSTNQPEGVILEDYVVLEVGAVVEAKRVGEGSIIEINAKVGRGAVIGKVCLFWCFPVYKLTYIVVAL